MAGNRRIFWNRLIPILFFISLLLFPFIVLSAGYKGVNSSMDFNTLRETETQKQIKQYQSDVRDIEAQIYRINSDIDWLDLKIGKIKDSDRKPTKMMLDSLTDKKERVLSLMKIRDRIKAVLGQNTTPREKTETQKISIKPLDDPKKLQKKDLVREIEKYKLTDWVELTDNGSCYELQTVLPILFSTGSARVAKEYKIFFKNLADFLKSHDVKVYVNGYADIVPIKNKKYPSNFYLGATRAANIAHILIGFGLKPEIFKVESSGKYRFAAKGMSNNKSFERRAEIKVVFSG